MVISGSLCGTSLYVGNQQGDYASINAAIGDCNGTGVFDIFIRPSNSTPTIIYENVVIA